MSEEQNQKNQTSKKEKEEKEEEKQENEETVKEEIERLKKELENFKSKCEEYLNGWKRERADFLNYKKEESERMAEIIKYANESLILKILDILDNLYLAETNLPEDLKNNKWIEGFFQIKKQLVDLLSKEGVKEIEVVGKKFDPSLMEILEEIETDKEIESGTVIEEIRKGYTLLGKLLRPAKVKVKK